MSPALSAMVKGSDWRLTRGASGVQGVRDGVGWDGGWGMGDGGGSAEMSRDGDGSGRMDVVGHGIDIHT